MTRGNQREKAREKNLKAQAGAVSHTIWERDGRYKLFSYAPTTVWRLHQLTGSGYIEEEHTIRH